MRILLAIIASMTLLCARAQTPLPVFAGGLGFMPWQAPLTGVPGSNLSTSKWQLRPTSGLTAGYLFYHGGISYLSAPLALTLYHPLTSNVTAFGGIYAAPTLFSVRDLYGIPPVNGKIPGSPFSRQYGLGVNAGIQGGLMYTNDAHTFSISAGVSVQNGSTPVYYPPQRVSNSKPR